MNPGSPTADGERGALQNRPARREEAGAVKPERGGRRGSRQPPAVTGPVAAFPWPASGRCECGRTRGAEDGVPARGLVHWNLRGGDFGVQSRAGPGSGSGRTGVRPGGLCRFRNREAGGVLRVLRAGSGGTGWQAEKVTWPGGWPRGPAADGRPRTRREPGVS